MSLTQRCIVLARLGRASRGRSVGCLEGTLNSGKGQGHCFSPHQCMATLQPGAKPVSSAPMNVHSTKIPSMDFVSRKKDMSVYCPPRPMVARRILGLGSCQALETSVQGKMWKNFCTCLLVMSIGTDSRVPGLRTRLPKLRPLSSVCSDRHLLLLGRLVLPLQVYEIGSRL